MPPSQLFVDAANVINPDTFATITEALAAANGGETIIVANGDYANVVIDKAITLQAANAGGATISGPGVNQGSAIRIEAGVDDVTIRGFNIEASAGDLAAVYAVGDNTNITITSNTIDGGTAGHAFLSGGANGNGLNDSTISGNTLLGNGGTGGTSAIVYINGAASLSVGAAGNQIIDNTIEGNPAGGLLMGVESGFTVITGNTFAGTASYAQLELFGGAGTIEDNDFGATGMFFVDGGSNYDAAAVLANNSYDGPVVYIAGESGFYATIQAAVNAAAAGDTLIVGNGDYTNVVINKAITLQAANEGGATISGPGVNQGSAIRIEAGVDDVTIWGFNIEASAGDLAAVYAVGDNTNITITSNTIDGGTAGHAFLSGGANGNGLNDSTISGNTLLGNGGTGGTSSLVYINGVASLGVTASQNTITGNTIQGNPTGGLLMGVESTNTEIAANTFAGTASYAQLEVFGAGGLIEGNAFNASGLAFRGSNYIADDIFSANTYDGPVVYIEGKSGFYATIQAAVDAAEAGDTIQIGGGTYNDDLVINKAGLTLEAAPEAVDTTITGSVTVSVTEMAATSLNTLDQLTSTQIGAVAVTKLTGTAADVAAAYASAGIAGLGAADVTLSDETAAAADINAIREGTIGVISAASLTTLTGTVADVATALDSSDITEVGEADVTLSDETAAAADINAIREGTTGVISATSLTTLTGTAADVAAAYASAGITGLDEADVTLSDETAAAADINTIRGGTTGVISAPSLTTLTGTVADVATALDSSGISGVSDAAVTLSDETAAAADLNEIDAATSGEIDAGTVTTLTGTAGEVAVAFAATGITGLGNADVTLSGTTAVAAALNALDEKTDGVIFAAAATTLLGTAADVATVYASDGIALLGDVNVTLSGTTAAATALRAIDEETTGDISAEALRTLTGTLADVAAVYDLPEVFIGLGDEAVTLSDTTVAALELNALDEKTEGLITAAAVTTLTGTAEDVAAAYDSTGITGLGAAAVTLSDTTVAAAALNAIDLGTSGIIAFAEVTTVTGTAADVAAAYASTGITGLDLAAVTLSGPMAAAAALNAIDLGTSGVIDAADIESLSGTAAEVATAYAATEEITGLGDVDVVLSDTTIAATTLNALEQLTDGAIFAGTVTTLTGTAADVATAYASTDIRGLDDAAVTLSGKTAAAADLIAIRVGTDGLIAAGTVTTLTGTVGEVAAVVAAGYDPTEGITGLGNEAVTLSGDTDTVQAAELNALDLLTSGRIAADDVTTLMGTAADVATAYASKGVTGLGNEAVILSDETLAASSLNALDLRTSGRITVGEATLTGTAAEVATAFASTEGITGLGGAAVTLSGTTAAAAALNAISEGTLGTIAASTVTTLTGTAENVAAVYVTGGIDELGDEAVTLSGKTAAAADLNAILEGTDGQITAAAVTTLTGTAAEVATTYAATGITGLGNEAVTLSDTTIAATTLNDLDLLTSGRIDADTVTTLTGTAADVATAYASRGIIGLGGAAVTLTDETLAASSLNALDLRTSGDIAAAEVTTLTGTAADVAAAYTSDGITGLGNEAVTLSGTAASAAALNAIRGGTSGTIAADTVTTLTGTAANLAAVYAATGITGLGNEVLTLFGKTAAVADLNALDLRTTGQIAAGTVTTLTGTAAAVATAYASTGISGLGNEAVTLSDTSAEVADLNALDRLTSGIVTAAAVTTLAGTVADVATAYASKGITGLGAAAVTLSGTTATAAALNAIDRGTSESITASTVTTLTGTAADVATAYTSGSITGLGLATVTLLGKTAAAADLNAIDLRTTGVIGAATVTTLTGTVDDVATAYAATGITGLGNEAVTLSDVSVEAADLNALDLLTSGRITAAKVTTVTGTAADVATAYASKGITGLRNEAVTLSDTALAASTLNALDLRTSGRIDADTVSTLTGTAADVAVAFASKGITGLGGAAVTLSGPTAAAAALNAIDRGTIGTIASTVSTLTGTADDVAAAYSSGITGLGGAAVTLSGTTAAAAALIDIRAGTSGAIAAATVRTVTGTAGDVATAYTSDGITGLGNEAVTLSGTTADAAALNSIDEGTSGRITAATVTTLFGTAADVVKAYASKGITGLGNEAVTLFDVTVEATSLMEVDAFTSGVVDASNVTTLSGSISAIAAAFSSAGITGLGGATVDVTGTSGDDTITATMGNDTINGGAGADVLLGGSGADTFVFVAGEGNGDRIVDFSGVGGDGDVLQFLDYGLGATVSDLTGGLFKISTADGSVVDFIIIDGAVIPNDWNFSYPI